MVKHYWRSVAPYSGAWIEIQITHYSYIAPWSHLIQVRGLKSPFGEYKIVTHQSHLIQVRGLKCYEDGKLVGEIESHLIQVRGLK